MQNLLNWIVRSSANPERVSMTIRGLLLSHLALIIMVSKAVGFNWAEGDIASFIEYAATLSGTLLTTFGIVRKVYFLVKKKA